MIQSARWADSIAPPEFLSGDAGLTRDDHDENDIAWEP